MSEQEVHYINAHGTATQEGDVVEASALKALLGERAPEVMVSSTKSMHGHLLGGAGAIEIMATTLALHTQTAPPSAHLDAIDPACLGLDHVALQARKGVAIDAALSNSFAFGGSNAVIALRAVAR
jgi:3-oxoacyl-[acyl-carrier-protein] synthase II